MTTFKEVCEQGGMFKCDKCGKTFEAKETKLEKAPTNISILTPIAPFIFIDKDNVVKSGGTSAEEGDKVLTCPHCNEAHPFGFNSV